MPTIDDLKTFLVEQHRQGRLLSDPSFLFSLDFLQHLLDFVDRSGQHPCPRCDAVVEGLSRQVAVMECWLRSLRGGAR